MGLCKTLGHEKSYSKLADRLCDEYTMLVSKKLHHWCSFLRILSWRELANVIVHSILSIRAQYTDLTSSAVK